MIGLWVKNKERDGTGAVPYNTGFPSPYPPVAVRGGGTSPRFIILDISDYCHNLWQYYSSRI